MFFDQTISILRKVLEKFFNFFPRTHSQERLGKQFEFDRSVHTFGILRALVLYVNGCFISSYCGTAMEGKGLREDIDS